MEVTDITASTRGTELKATHAFAVLSLPSEDMELMKKIAGGVDLAHP